MGKAARVPASSLKKAFGLLEALYAAGDTASLVNTLFDEIGALAPHESAVYFPLDTERGGMPSSAGHIYKNIDGGDKIAVLYGTRYSALDPLKKLCLPGFVNKALKNTDVAPINKLTDGEFYCDFLKPIGITYVCGVALSFNGRPVGGIGLHRPPGSSDFSDTEKAVLTLLAPHMAYVINNHEARKGKLGFAARFGESSAMKVFDFSRREAEVAALAARGLKNSEIADMLFITEYTVKDHLRAIYKKTGVKSRSGLVVKLFSR